jgi:hypothetical protein
LTPFAGALKTRLGLTVTSEKVQGGDRLPASAPEGAEPGFLRGALMGALCVGRRVAGFALRDHRRTHQRVRFMRVW